VTLVATSTGDCDGDGVTNKDEINGIDDNPLTPQTIRIPMMDVVTTSRPSVCEYKYCGKQAIVIRMVIQTAQIQTHKQLQRQMML
jgi:hypothetical protein